MEPVVSPSTFRLLQSSTLISQGAEAKVYKGRLQGNIDSPSNKPVLLKHRFQKGYRHPSLDASLTRARIAGEARALLKCLRSGVNVPGVRMVDPPAGVLGIDWIEGKSVRVLLPPRTEEAECEREDVLGGDNVVREDSEHTLDAEFGVDIDRVMEMIGAELGKMHADAEIIHGDLTTSNMMLRRTDSNSTTTIGTEIVLIDFGLSYHSSLVEDKAVDLYVLERAFSSTHPDSQPLFEKVLRAYAKQVGKAQWEAVKRRLDEVRLRGRKRSMVG